MKKILLALSLIVCPPAFAAPETIELTPSCMWMKNQGTCVVSSRNRLPLTCKVTVTGTTFSGIKIGNSRTLMIRPGETSQRVNVFSAPADIFVTVSGTADCTN